MDDGMDGVIGGAAPYSPITRRLSLATVPTRLPFDRFRLPFLGTSPRANPKPAPASYWPVPKCRAWPPNQANCPLQRTGQMRGQRKCATKPTKNVKKPQPRHACTNGCWSFRASASPCYVTRGPPMANEVLTLASGQTEPHRSRQSVPDQFLRARPESDMAHSTPCHLEPRGAAAGPGSPRTGCRKIR